ncbi:MAG: MASE3 domain-containing protein [Desulfobaccales bacterium]
MDERLLTPSALVSYVLWGLLLLGLLLTSRYSYLLFHSIAGFFSAVIATGVFAIAWNARLFQENNYLLFLGIAYLFVGALDLLYTLSYQGMGVFPGAGLQLPAHLWLAARSLEAVSLFLAPQCIGRRLRPYAVLSGYLLAFITIILMIFVWRQVPFDLVAPGPVLAALQKTAEYFNSVILLGAMALLWRQRSEFDPGVLRLLLGAIALAIASEVALTFLAGVSAQAGLAGHLLKIASLYLIYRALIATELIKPYNRLFHNLRLSSEVVRQEKDFADRLIEMAQVIVLVLDAEGRIIRLNRMCEAITGYALADVRNRPFWEVFPAPEEVDEVQEAFFDLIAGDFSQSWQIDWVAKDGTRRLIAWSNTAFPKEDGSVEYVIGTGIDISGYREVEKRLQRLNGKLEQQIQKEPEITKREVRTPYRDLDSCPDTIFHDFKVLGRWLRGYCRALEEHSAQQLDVKGRNYLERMHGVILQLGELIEARLEVSRLGRLDLHREEIDLSHQARLIAEGLKRTAPARRVEFIIEPGLSALGDPTMLRSVLQNLLGNAWKFTEELPQGIIEFGALPAKNCHKGFFVRDNRTDFGIHYGHKLFRSFQRLHAGRDFSGADVRLATVRSIILRHGGRIWAKGAMGQGVTFYFTLPHPPPGIDHETAKGDQPNSQTN